MQLSNVFTYIIYAILFEVAFNVIANRPVPLELMLFPVCYMFVYLLQCAKYYKKMFKNVLFEWVLIVILTILFIYFFGVDHIGS